MKTEPESIAVNKGKSVTVERKLWTDEEHAMLIADMIHSCSNDKVAQAAVSCIGGQFCERAHAVARRNGLNVGRFVAIVVRHFALRANDETHAALRVKIAGADQPLLLGLRHIVEPALEDGVLFFDHDIPGMADCVVSGAASVGLQQFH